MLHNNRRTSVQVNFGKNSNNRIMLPTIGELQAMDESSMSLGKSPRRGLGLARTESLIPEKMEALLFGKNAQGNDDDLNATTETKDER